MEVQACGESGVGLVVVPGHRIAAWPAGNVGGCCLCCALTAHFLCGACRSRLRACDVEVKPGGRSARRIRGLPYRGMGVPCDWRYEQSRVLAAAIGSYRRGAVRRHQLKHVINYLKCHIAAPCCDGGGVIRGRASSMRMVADVEKVLALCREIGVEPW